MRKYDMKLESIDLTAAALAGYDAVIIATDHSNYDYSFIVSNSKLVIDTRNATATVPEYRDRIVRA
jgi:UDP-N-acetyl-D-glucosamine dehydrogenase